MKHIWLPLALAPALLFAEERVTCRLPLMQSPREAQVATIHQLSLATESVAPSKRRAVTPPASTTLPVTNFIDTDLSAAMSKDGIVPTALSGDEEFLRRVSLDLTGQIPDAAAVT